MNRDDDHDNPWGGDWTSDDTGGADWSSEPTQQPTAHQPHQQQPTAHQPHQQQPHQQSYQGYQPSHSQPPAPHQGPYGYQQPYAQQSASGLAVATLIAGISGWTFVPLLGSLAAVIMGFIEWNNIKNGQSSEQGKIFVIIGASLGGVSLAIYLLFCSIFFLPFLCIPFA